ncbi:hypothetical protein [Flavobacterium sp. 3HN19-14]|uniref:hypothetical protein n=1 Tax=Flavobacterium sp. 3HN19-14 TaxID=3448133 RepID=UPI003EE0C308
MENKKDIGHLFREKLNALDKTPDDAVWRSISADLDKRRKKRVLFWLTAAAAVLLTGFSVWIIAGRFSSVEAAVETKSPVQKATTNTVVTGEEQQTEIQTDTTFKNKKATKSKVTVTRKLIKSNDEIDEYEVVTRYKVYVKKTKTATVTTKKTSSAKGKASKNNVDAKKPVASKTNTVTSKKAISKKRVVTKSSQSKNKNFIASKGKKKHNSKSTKGKRLSVRKKRPLLPKRRKPYLKKNIPFLKKIQQQPQSTHQPSPFNPSTL